MQGTLARFTQQKYRSLVRSKKEGRTILLKNGESFKVVVSGSILSSLQNHEIEPLSGRYRNESVEILFGKIKQVVQ